MLDEIYAEEHEAGQGMRSAAVLESESFPAQGFFNLAQDLGLDTSDWEAFWIGEYNRAYAAWRGE